jgi:pimeloyl-ACP methyl ester carboxylesterase
MTKLRTLLMAACLFLLTGCPPPPPVRPPAPPTATIKQVNVNGVTLTYQEQGRGEPVLFVHGSHTDHRMWEPQREAFAKQPYRFIALDQRYFGTAPWPDKGEKFSIATHNDDLAAFIRELKTGPVHLVGWSYSGTTLLDFAVQHPDLVSSVLVYDPSLATWVTNPADLQTLGGEIQEILGPLAAAVQSGDNAAAVRVFTDRASTKEPADTFDTLPQAVRTMMLENARMLPLLIAAPPPPPVTCEQLAQIKVPVTIVRGELSRALFVINADTASKCIPKAHLVIMAKARHLGPMQDPAAFNTIVLDALKNY